MLKGVRGLRIFHDVSDYLLFERYLGQALTKYQGRCHAYCWMPNHAHLLIQVAGAPLHKIMHSLANRYAKAYNRKYDLRGHVFQGRFARKHIHDDAYLQRVVLYIHLNPVPSVVRRPELHEWSSFDGYFRGAPSKFLTTRYILRNVHPDPIESRETLLAMHDTAGPIEITWDRGDELMGEDDETDIEDEIVSLADLIDEVTSKYGIQRNALGGPSRAREVSAARAWLGLRALQTGCASLSEVARELNRSPQAISQLVLKLEARAPQSTS